jgi:hypothetical protein
MMGCEYHHCQVSFAPLSPEDLDRLLDLVPALRANDLFALHEKEKALSLNYDRQAVQVLGCDDLVVASVPFTPDQIRGLRSVAGG